MGISISTVVYGSLAFFFMLGTLAYASMPAEDDAGVCTLPSFILFIIFTAKAYTSTKATQTKIVKQYASEDYNQQLAEYHRSLQQYQNHSTQKNDPRQQQVRELQQQTKHLQDMDGLKREMDELKYNQLKQEMERLTSEMKTEKQQINISVERIGDTIQDSVVSGYKKARDTPEKDDTEAK
ncbi:MAG: hypothetical protein QF536_09795 [Arenicellales bacterium]|nr:hypothetical protein [Arenicellales bacterium]